jgi:polyhydroxybutyrate depolymerase
MKPGTYPQNITVQGAQRTYILHVPPSYDGSKPLPLVFILHGFGGNAMSMVKLTGMSDKADQENFFVAYLNGTEASSADNSVSGQAWNSGLTPELNMTVDDVEFVRELAAKLETQLNVDAKRIYAAGFSNGAFMSHRLGAELPNLLAGVAVVEGTIGIQKSDGTFAMIPNAAGPISIVIIHGKLDTNVEYDGGQATKGAGKIFAKSVADAVAFWTSADGCTGSPQQQTRPDGNVIKQDYISCSEGTEVQFFTVVNGVHEWPTLQGHTKFSATDAIWAFFSQHALP